MSAEKENFWMLLDMGYKPHGDGKFYFIFSCRCDNYKPSEYGWNVGKVRTVFSIEA